MNDEYPRWEARIKTGYAIFWYSTVATYLVPKLLRHNKWYRRLWRYVMRLWRGTAAWVAQREEGDDEIT